MLFAYDHDIEFIVPPPPHDPTAASRAVYQLGEELGFALVGICDARPTQHDQHLRDWLDAGQHGEMAYLADHLDVRLDPERLLPGVRSIICVADAYPSRATTDAADDDQPRGRIARYAWGDDYHKTIKRRLHTLADHLSELFPGHTFRSVVDTAPFLEREHAARAGLGWQAKNTMLIHPRVGSYLLLGAVATTLELQSSEAAGWQGGAGMTVAPADPCGTCTRCIDACPTQCIDAAGYALDASRCISYLTLEHRSPIDAGLHEAMGDWVAGCDVCQEVCPHNRERTLPALPDPATEVAAPNAYTPRSEWAQGPPLLDLLNWTEEDRRRAFTRSALKRVKLDMLKRNALIAAGNALAKRDDPALRRRVEELAVDESEPPLVRATAKQVLRSLSCPY